MPTFLFPVEGLSVETALDVGPVLFRPGAEALGDLRKSINDDQLWAFAERTFANHGEGAIAQVETKERDEALAMTRTAIDLLRVYQHVRYWLSDIGQFGMAGDLAQGLVPYGQIQDGQAGPGWMRFGSHLGWTFGATDDWSSQTTFRHVASAIGTTQPVEGDQRALIGIHYLSQALADQRAPFKMVALVTALEALLLPRRGRGHGFRLARAISFFGCGSQDENLCGRARETCPYLALDPARSGDEKRLRRLRSEGTVPPWRCSEWHRAVDWYDLRSDVVHGAGPLIDSREATKALFWVIRYLTEPILQWLVTHPVEPIGGLDAALRALPEPPDWDARLGALGTAPD